MVKVLKIAGLESWTASKKSGAFSSLEEDDLEMCQGCNEICEDLLQIKCGHIFCNSCVEGIPEFADDEDLVAGVGTPNHVMFSC